MIIRSHDHMITHDHVCVCARERKTLRVEVRDIGGISYLEDYSGGSEGSEGSTQRVVG